MPPAAAAAAAFLISKRCAVLAAASLLREPGGGGELCCLTHVLPLVLNESAVAANAPRGSSRDFLKHGVDVVGRPLASAHKYSRADQCWRQASAADLRQAQLRVWAWGLDERGMERTEQLRAGAECTWRILRIPRPIPWN